MLLTSIEGNGYSQKISEYETKNHVNKTLEIFKNMVVSKQVFIPTSH